jgi:predicted MPP superfamily phosphohydrolase
MHFGRLSGISHLKRLIKNIQAIQPELILLPGDIIDDELEPFIQKNMGEIMSNLKAPLGVFGVLGNHEYYGRQIPQFIEQMNNININILMDESITIDGSFHLLGRKDKTDKERKSFHELLTDIDHSLPIIAMDHQPYEMKQATENGVDVLFSGHTHRGQMAPNHLITRRMFELDWGYLQREQLHAFVSSGYGFWGPPMRLGSRSEILQIDISFV